MLIRETGSPTYLSGLRTSQRKRFFLAKVLFSKRCFTVNWISFLSFHALEGERGHGYPEVSGRHGDICTTIRAHSYLKLDTRTPKSISVCVDVCVTPVSALIHASYNGNCWCLFIEESSTVVEESSTVLILGLKRKKQKRNFGVRR